MPIDTAGPSQPPSRKKSRETNSPSHGPRTLQDPSAEPRSLPTTTSYAELVSWLTDFERLALLPAPGERTGLASSYDRASRYDAEQDRYLEWGANRDGEGIVREEEGGDVLAEIEGPGALVRIWMAPFRPWMTCFSQANLKLFFDGAETPLFNAPLESFFDHSLSPFTWPNLVLKGEGAPALNNYVPVPFERSLKIMAAPKSGGYFQFTYVQIPRSEIASLALPLSSEAQSALALADHRLSRPDRDAVAGKADAAWSFPENIGLADIALVSREGPAARALASRRPNQDSDEGEPSAGVSVHEIDVVAEPQTAQSILDFAGPAAITSLRIELELPSDGVAQRRLLRELAIRVAWDNEAAPSIWAPLGDFFGFLGGARRFRAYPVGGGPDGIFYSDWYMPFAERAEVEIVNDGGECVPIHCELVTAPLRFPASDYGRFHAKWHRDAFLPARADREPDWTILTTRGRGRYVGLHLHVWNPAGEWWGEGDEKFFVDGEKFPSIFGTGSEDYFGYSWGDPGLFSRPFHNQILNEDNAGHIVNNRWHFADSVPFQSSFEGCIEKYFLNERSTLYAAVAYWYLEPGGQDPYGPVSLAERVDYWR